MKRLVITGALGHIGSRLIHSLTPDAFSRVDIIDDLSTQRYVSLFNLPAGVPFRFIQCDILKAGLEQEFSGADVVVHLAAITDAAGSVHIRERVEEVNFRGTEAVARACLTCGCKLIFASTTSVYGVQSDIVEESTPLDQLKPQSPYAESKLQAERLMQQLGEEGLRYTIFRFGTIVGPSPGMRFHTAVNKFVWQACLGESLTVWRTALHQKRPYLDLRDAIGSIQFAIENDRCDNELYNVVTANATVAQIIDMIRPYVPDTTISYVDERIMNQLSYEVSSAKLEAAGFHCTGDLRRAIHETVGLLAAVRSGTVAGV